MKKWPIVFIIVLFTTNTFAQTNWIRDSGNVGIGTTSPGAKLSFNDLNDGSDGADGITWYSPTPLYYGIYRTAGSWLAPDYQQLKINFETGIVLNPGSYYGKSFVEIQGSGGLRIPSGKLGLVLLVQLKFFILNLLDQRRHGLAWKKMPEWKRELIFEKPAVFFSIYTVIMRTTMH